MTTAFMQALDGVAAGDLGCTVALSSGSVIADATVELPVATLPAVVDAVSEGLLGNIVDAVEDDPDVAALELGDPSDVSVTPESVRSLPRFCSASLH